MGLLVGVPGCSVIHICRDLSSICVLHIRKSICGCCGDCCGLSPTTECCSIPVELVVAAAVIVKRFLLQLAERLFNVARCNRNGADGAFYGPSEESFVLDHAAYERWAFYDVAVPSSFFFIHVKIALEIQM